MSGFLAVVVLGALGAALLVSAYRVATGPTAPDRIVAVDGLVLTLLGGSATVAVFTGVPAYLDIALVLGASAFVGTVALARYLLRGELFDRDR